MKILKSLSLLAFVAITTFACKKDAVVVDNTALLTTGKWKLTAETTAGADTYKDYVACEKDNTWAFAAATGVATLDEGATKCDPTDAQSETGTWAFAGTDKKSVILTVGIIGLTFTINELTSSTLKWQFTNPFDNKVIIQTLTH